MQIKLILKPCPWCRKTPDIFMPTCDGTWLWEIQCNNKECRMKPKSPHVAIRNTKKKDFFLFHGKLEILCDRWNKGNPFKAFEAKLVDLSSLAELNASAEALCNSDKWFQTIGNGL